MPLNRGKDIHGEYYIWGTTNKRYYYNPNILSSKLEARNRALKQARAIMYSYKRRGITNKY